MADIKPVCVLVAVAGLSTESREPRGWQIQPEIREGFLREVILELHFEGRRNSLYGKLEKSIPGRGNGMGKGSETEII